MDRPQAVAYSAGFFDGEGCISMESYNGGWQFRCITTQKFHDEPLHLMAETFGGKVYWFNSDKRSAHVVRGKKAVDMLIEMMPFLTVKRDQAEIAVRFFDMSSEERDGALAEVRALKKQYKFLGA